MIKKLLILFSVFFALIALFTYFLSLNLSYCTGSGCEGMKKGIALKKLNIVVITPIINTILSLFMLSSYMLFLYAFTKILRG